MTCPLGGDPLRHTAGSDDWHEEGPDADNISEVVDARWSLPHHRRRYAAADRLSILLWNVPTSMSILAISQVLSRTQSLSGDRFPKITWEGTGANARVQLLFKTAVLRDAVFPTVKSCVNTEGWVAKPSRPYHVRRQQRLSRTAKASPPTQPQLPNSGGYDVLSSSGSEAATAEADPDPVPAAALDSLPRSHSTKPVREARLRLGTLNIRGGLRSKAEEVEQHLAKCHLDIVGLCETRLGEQSPPEIQGYQLHLGHQRDSGGVALLVASHIAASVSVLAETSEDQLWIRVAGSRGEKDLYICVAYLPQSNAPAGPQAFEDLTTQIRKYKKLGSTVVLGDFNAWLGQARNAEERDNMGPFGDRSHKRNRNGKLLTTLLETCEMKSLNGFSQPTDEDVTENFWFTRYDPVNQSRTMIDYILVDSGVQVDEFGVDYTDLGSDHHLVWSVLRSTRLAWRRRGRRRRKRYRSEKFLSGPNQTDTEASLCKSEFQEQLTSLFEDFELPDTTGMADDVRDELISEKNNDVVRRILSAVEASAGTSSCAKGLMRSWWDDEVKQAVQSRRAAYQKLLRGDIEWAAYTEIRSATRKLVGQKKKADWDKSIAQLPVDGKARHMKQVWRTLNRLRSSRKTKHPTGVRRPNGELATTFEDRTEAWAEYMEELGKPTEDPVFDAAFAHEVEKEVGAHSKAEALQPPLPPMVSVAAARAREEETNQEYMSPNDNQPSDSSDLSDFSPAPEPAGHDSDTPPPPEPAPALNDKFSKCEVAQVVRKLKLGKAAGPDMLQNEMFKAGGEILIDILLFFFNWINHAGMTPREWGTANVTTLHKKGDVTDPANYRTISLISCLGKAYVSVWAKRISMHMEPRLGESQGGFRPGRSTNDQVFAMYEALMRRRKRGLSSYVFFIDFKKAFDTVWHAGLFKRMADCGVTGMALQMVKSLYRDIRLRVIVDDTPGRAVPTLQGVRQGCPLSPILFNIFVEGLASELQKVGGIDLEGQKLHSLLFADDISALAETAADLQDMINVVDEYCRKWRMTVHPVKSKVLVVPAQGIDPKDREGEAWVYRSEPLGEVTEYEYLGMWIDSKLQWTCHLKKLVSKCKAANLSLGRLLSNRQVPTALKKLIWCAVVRSKIDYGSAIYVADSRQAQALESIQHSAGTKMLATNSRAERSAIRTLVGFECDVSTRRRATRMKYLHSLSTMGEERWAKYITELPAPKSKLRGPAPKHWPSKVSKEVEDMLSVLQDEDEEATVFTDLADLLTHVGSIPKKQWSKTVNKWAKSVDVASGVDAQPSGSNLITRLRAGCPVGSTPTVAQSLATNADIQRVRLLSGSHALHSFIGRYHTRANSSSNSSRKALECPSCQTAPESIHHFLRTCCPERVEDAIQKLREVCSCDDNCADMYSRREGADTADQMLFLLGTPPTKGNRRRKLCEAGNQELKKLLQSLWDRRCKALSSLNNAQAEEPVESDGSTESEDSDNETESGSDSFEESDGTEEVEILSESESSLDDDTSDGLSSTESASHLRNTHGSGRWGNSFQSSLLDFFAISGLEAHGYSTMPQ